MACFRKNRALKTTVKKIFRSLIDFYVKIISLASGDFYFIFFNGS